MKVAVVTGSNKGIGLGVVRGLCEKFDGDVFLTSRNEDRGLAAIKTLEKEGLSPKLAVLDLGKEETIEQLRDLMKEKYGGIDVLVNNAGIAFDVDATESFAEQARVTLATNYWANKRCCEILFPILKSGARVVNMSSSMGFLGVLDLSSNKEEAEKKKKILASEDLKVSQLDDLMLNFVKAAEEGTHGDAGWPNSTYMVSKVGWSALSRIQQREFLSDSRTDIAVNYVHPGYVDTDLSNHTGVSIDEGAKSAIFGALLPPEKEIKGCYIWEDCQVIDWVNWTKPTIELAKRMSK